MCICMCMCMCMCCPCLYILLYPLRVQVFDDIRARFPHYRIAIVYITASETVVRQRIHARSLKTGRMVPESQIVRSLESPEKSIALLAPKTDLVVRIGEHWETKDINY